VSEAALNLALGMGILAACYLLTNWFARAMYRRCHACGTLNARRRAACRACGRRLA
jgi:rRNA maturation endonuclease Nob1